MTSKDLMNSRQAARKEIGRRILKAINTHPHLSRAEIARRAGLHPSTLSTAISGKRGLPDDKREALAKVLGCSVASLTPGGPEPYQDQLSAEAAVQMGEDLPEGLGGFLERRKGDPRINDRIRWYLTQTRTRAEPWVKFDDFFWDEMTDFWVGYLAKREKMH